jgi:hypothetical protein
LGRPFADRPSKVHVYATQQQEVLNPQEKEQRIGAIARQKML